MRIPGDRLARSPTIGMPTAISALPISQITVNTMTVRLRNDSRIDSRGLRCAGRGSRPFRRKSKTAGRSHQRRNDAGGADQQGLIPPVEGSVQAAEATAEKIQKIT